MNDSLTLLCLVWVWEGGRFFGIFHRDGTYHYDRASRVGW